MHTNHQYQDSNISENSNTHNQAHVYSKTPQNPQAQPFTPTQQSTIQETLNTPLPRSSIAFRPSAQGQVAYVEGWKSLSLANDAFSFNGWSSEILHLASDYQVTDNQGRHSIGIYCVIRVHLRDGTFHDDVGYGHSENQKSRGQAWEKARKEAVTDGMKRALRIFGSALGNCLYDKQYLKSLNSNNQISNNINRNTTTFNNNRSSRNYTSHEISNNTCDSSASSKRTNNSMTHVDKSINRNTTIPPSFTKPSSSAATKHTNGKNDNSSGASNSIPLGTLNTYPAPPQIPSSESCTTTILTEEQLLECGEFFDDEDDEGRPLDDLRMSPVVRGTNTRRHSGFKRHDLNSTMPFNSINIQRPK